jgi:hypothetical protein
MEKTEQRRIAQEIIEGFTASLLGAVEKMPEDWNGFEIRQLAADIAYNHARQQKGKLPCQKPSVTAGYPKMN